MEEETIVVSDMIIVGLLDGPWSDTPKSVELYVVNDIPDLSIYGIGSANNGGGTDGQEWTFISLDTGFDAIAGIELFPQLDQVSKRLKLIRADKAYIGEGCSKILLATLLSIFHKIYI